MKKIIKLFDLIDMKKLLREADGDAAEQAHNLGLTSGGWGTWKDKSGNTVAKTVQGNLVKLDGGEMGGGAGAPPGEPPKTPTGGNGGNQPPKCKQCGKTISDWDGQSDVCGSCMETSQFQGPDESKYRFRNPAGEAELRRAPSVIDPIPEDWQPMDLRMMSRAGITDPNECIDAITKNLELIDWEALAMTDHGASVLDDFEKIKKNIPIFKKVKDTRLKNAFLNYAEHLQSEVHTMKTDGLADGGHDNDSLIDARNDFEGFADEYDGADRGDRPAFTKYDPKSAPKTNMVAKAAEHMDDLEMGVNVIMGIKDHAERNIAFERLEKLKPALRRTMEATGLIDPDLLDDLELDQYPDAFRIAKWIKDNGGGFSIPGSMPDNNPQHQRPDTEIDVDELNSDIWPFVSWNKKTNSVDFDEKGYKKNAERNRY